MKQQLQYPMMIGAACLLVCCAKQNDSPGHGGGFGSNGISGTFHGLTSFDCVPPSNGSYLDTVVVSAFMDGVSDLIVRGDTFIQRTDTSVLYYEHGNSYLVYTRPDNQMNLKFHWLGDDGFGTPGCVYLFEANY